MYLDGLNANQRRAVIAPATGRLQIIAGPGTGKTKVLVSRVAYLLLECKIPPNHIIVTTFTKKAANEMIERLEKLLEVESDSIDLSKLIIGTFHSICFRIIMTYGKLIDRQNFRIADERDSNHILNEVLEAVNTKDFDSKEVDMYMKNGADSSALDLKRIKRQISKLKSSGTVPEAYRQQKSGRKGWNSFIYTVYLKYQDNLADNSLLDFDDCLLSCHVLLTQHQVLSSIQHVLVDEFQDTNEIQLQLMYELTKYSNNVTIVGDPDQSIYGFRDAQVVNFQKMKNHYKTDQVDVISLDENYRSTLNILELSELVMRQEGDKNRHIKDLKSQHDLTFKATYSNLTSQEEEAEWICFQLEQLTKKLPNTPFLNRDIAILFRSSFQTRIVENELVKRKIPYFMLRGKAFWDRKEVVSILDYLRAVSNGSDRIAYLRTINFPKRGLGVKAIEEIDRYLNKVKDQEGQDVFDHLKGISEGYSDCKLSRANLENLAKYLNFIDRCRQKLDQGIDIEEIFLEIYVESGLKDEFSEDPNYELNIFEVKRQLVEFEPVEEKLPLDDDLIAQDNDVDVAKNILEQFVQSIGLYESNQNQDSSEEDTTGGKVVLSTIHGSKGLEWPIVFVPGLSEGIIPAKFAMDNGGTEDEERRCFYVATTRAKYLLYISSFTESRERWGRLPINEISRFLKGVKGRTSNDRQEAFKDLRSIQDLHKLVGKEWVAGLHDYERFMIESNWDLKEEIDKVATVSNLAHSNFGSAKFVPNSEYSVETKGKKIEKKVQNKTILSMLGGTRKNIQKRKTLQVIETDNIASNLVKTITTNKPIAGISKLSKVSKVASTQFVSPVSTTSSRAPPYIPTRKVPGSLSRIKKLHEMKK